MIRTNRPLRTTLLAAALAVSFTAPAYAAKSLNEGDMSQGGQYTRFIVSYKKGSPERGNAALRQKSLDEAGKLHGVKVGQVRHLAVGADAIRIDHALDAAAAKKFMLSLKRNPQVDYVEVDAVMRPALSPNDTHYGLQWHYSEATAGINAPAAWDITTGTGVVVGVLDTGITAHTDLNANMIGGYDFITDVDAANDGGGRDSDPSDPGDWVTANQCGSPHAAQDSSWHGTHVAGTIAAVTNNASGVAGVAFDAQVVNVRVLGTCGGSTSDIADAIVWAAGGAVSGAPANANPVEVINMSLGGSGACGATSQAAIDYAVSQGVVVVVAAGNDNDNASGYNPASCANVITIGAVGRTGARASYSNYGAVVDVSAPGGDAAESVISTLNLGTTIPGAQGYAGYQGTSMASPHVAGVVALMQSLNATSPAVVEGVLKATSRPFPVTCTLGCGAGLVDAPSALAAIEGPILTLNGPVPTDEGDSGTHTVDFTVSLSEAAASDVTFNFATANGTASAGTDYVARSNTGQVILAGQTSKVFSVTVNGDATSEGEEKFTASVSSVTGPVTAAITTATSIILEDDALVLTAGVPITGLSGSKNTEKLYALEVPSGASNLVIQSSGGGNGDMDMYVKFGTAPTTSSADCASETATSVESCTFPTPSAGRYYVLLRAFSSYNSLTLQADYDLAPQTPLSIGNNTVVEGASGTRTITFTASIPAPQATTVTFDATTANVNATAGSDYVALNATGLTIPAGQTTKTFTVTINGDAVIEPNEVFYVNLSNVVNASIGDGQATGLIYNDDGSYLQIGDASIGEGDAGTKVLNFTVFLNQAAAVPVTYTATTSSNSATTGSDFVARSLAGESIPAGQLSKTFSVTLNGDTTVEQNEAFYVTLSAVTGVSVFDSLASGTILNDDGVYLTIDNPTMVEGPSSNRPLNFTVSLSQAAAVPVTFSINTANGSALAGSDYVSRGLIGQTIPAGETSKTFTVAIYGDTTVEPNETVLANVANVSGATLFDSQGSGTIFNDDGPSLSISDVSITEGNAGTKNMVFTVALSQVAGVPVTYNIATANGSADASDFVANSATGETITAGLLSKTFTVVLNGDTTIEGNDSFFVTLSAATGATIFDNQAVGTLLNDDGATLSIGNTQVVEGDAGTKNLVFTVSLSQALAVPVSYDIATATSGSAVSGVDFVGAALEGETIAAGMLAKTFTVQINGDTTVEANEAFYVNLSNSTGASILDNQATGLIYNDDGPTLSIGDASVSEGNAGTKVLTFTVSLSQAAAGPVTYTIGTLNNTASAGSDYVASSLPGQTITAGNLSKTFDVTINGDTTLEGHEDFFVSLSAVTGATVLDSQAAGVINNDD